MLSESQTQKTIHCMILSSKTGKASLLEQCLLEGRGQGDRVARDMRKLFGVMGCSVPYRIRGWFSREAAVLGERTVAALCWPCCQRRWPRALLLSHELCPGGSMVGSPWQPAQLKLRGHVRCDLQISCGPSHRKADVSGWGIEGLPRCPRTDAPSEHATPMSHWALWHGGEKIGVWRYEFTTMGIRQVQWASMALSSLS